MSNQSSMQLEQGTGSMTVDLRTVVAARKSPGIVILSGLGEVLHLNDTAWEALTLIRPHGAVSCDGVVPQPLTDLCHELEAKLTGHNLGARNARLEATRLIVTEDGGVLLRALALEGAKDVSSEARRFLIMLEHVAERGQGNEAGKERYCLTDREWQVTQALAKGFTNKEIGNALRITEPTVKSHIKHIMQKMKCTTRTAIVSQLAGSMACGSA